MVEEQDGRFGRTWCNSVENLADEEVDIKVFDTVGSVNFNVSSYSTAYPLLPPVKL